MFVDYYSVLEIEQSAVLSEIKAAFKKQALKYHPDRNQGKDTTEMMQLINEAYLILKDKEARTLYDIEYNKFKGANSSSYSESKKDTYSKASYEYSYTVSDDTLEKWMQNAKQQAIDLAKQTIKDFKDISKDGAKAAGKGFVYFIIGGILFALLSSIIRGCH